MKPVLFSVPLGGRALDVATYGLAIALGFAVGVVVAARAAKRTGLDPGAVLDAAFWILVTGIAGSRVLYVLQHAGTFARMCVGTGAPRSFGRVVSDCAAPLRIWEGGLVYLGGALTAAGAVALFASRRRLPFGRLADAFAPGLALGHAVGRIGCFFAGCCYGPAGLSGPPGVRFPPASVAYLDFARSGALHAGANATAPLHPAMLYEALLELLIFFALLRYGRRRPFWGAVALMYAVLYGAARIVLEAFRGDPGRGFVFEAAIPSVAKLLTLPMDAPLFLSTAQATAAVIAVVALVVLLGRRARITG